jgi:xylulokinase/glycerol kinase
MVEANVLTCCSAFDWFCQNFYDWDDRIDYEKINHDLRELDGMVSSAVVLPYFQGRSTPEWNPEAKAVFGEISLSTNRKELLKALLEGIFLEIKNNISLFGDYAEIKQAYISGGMTNSSVINQLQADIYGVTLYRMEDSESTALGALMVALEGLNAYSSIGEAFENIRGNAKLECYQPRAEQSEAYEMKREQMNRLYKEIYS